MHNCPLQTNCGGFLQQLNGNGGGDYNCSVEEEGMESQSYFWPAEGGSVQKEVQGGAQEEARIASAKAQECGPSLPSVTYPETLAGTAMAQLPLWVGYNEIPENRRIMFSFNTCQNGADSPQSKMDKAIYCKSEYQNRRTLVCRLSGKLRYWDAECPQYCGHHADKLSGVCMMGDMCPFAHNSEEVEYHAAKYKTRLCTGEKCRGSLCYYAHGEHELRHHAASTYSYFNLCVVGGSWLPPEQGVPLVAPIDVSTISSNEKAHGETGGWIPADVLPESHSTATMTTNGVTTSRITTTTATTTHGEDSSPLFSEPLSTLRTSVVDEELSTGDGRGGLTSSDVNRTSFSSCYDSSTAPGSIMVENNDTNNTALDRVVGGDNNGTQAHVMGGWESEINKKGRMKVGGTGGEVGEGGGGGGGGTAAAVAAAAAAALCGPHQSACAAMDDADALYAMTGTMTQYSSKPMLEDVGAPPPSSTPEEGGQTAISRAISTDCSFDTDLTHETSVDATMDSYLSSSKGSKGHARMGNIAGSRDGNRSSVERLFGDGGREARQDGRSDEDDEGSYDGDCGANDLYTDDEWGAMSDDIDFPPQPRLYGLNGTSSVDQSYNMIADADYHAGTYTSDHAHGASCLAGDVAQMGVQSYHQQRSLMPSQGPLARSNMGMNPSAHPFHYTPTASSSSVSNTFHTLNGVGSYRTGAGTSSSLFGTSMNSGHAGHGGHPRDHSSTSAGTLNGLNGGGGVAPHTLNVSSRLGQNQGSSAMMNFHQTSAPAAAAAGGMNGRTNSVGALLSSGGGVGLGGRTHGMGNGIGTAHGNAHQGQQHQQPSMYGGIMHQPGDGGVTNNGNSQALQGLHLKHHQHLQQLQQSQRFTKGFNGDYPLRRGNSNGMDDDYTNVHGSTTPIGDYVNGYGNGYGGGLNGHNGLKSSGFHMLGQHGSTRNVQSSSLLNLGQDAESQLASTTQEALDSHIPAGGALLENGADFQDLAQAGNVKFVQSANGRISVISASNNASGNGHGNGTGGGNGAAMQGNGTKTMRFLVNGTNGTSIAHAADELDVMGAMSEDEDENGEFGRKDAKKSKVSIAPSIYKQRFCSTYPHTHLCERGSNCAFAHTRNEIRCPILSEAEEDQSKMALTDEFLMYKFKTIWCPIGVKHDWQSCVYAHNYQDARRNPEIGYGPKQCPMWGRREISTSYDNRCPNGVRCPYAHGAKEQLYHPVHLKTRFCQDSNGGKEGKDRKLCPRGRLCAFWHTEKDRKVFSEEDSEFDYSQELGDEQIVFLQSDFTTPTVFEAGGENMWVVQNNQPGWVPMWPIGGSNLLPQKSDKTLSPTNGWVSPKKPIIDEQSLGKEQEYEWSFLDLPLVNGFVHFEQYPSIPKTLVNAHVPKSLRKLLRNNSF